jgi:uncharacterized protein YgfB (UPF0149 family)
VKKVLLCNDEVVVKIKKEALHTWVVVIRATLGLGKRDKDRDTSAADKVG